MAFWNMNKAIENHRSTEIVQLGRRAEKAPPVLQPQVSHPTDARFANGYPLSVPQ